MSNPPTDGPKTAGDSLRTALAGKKPIKQRWNDFFMRRNRLRDVFLVLAVIFGNHEHLEDGIRGLPVWVLIGLAMVLFGTALHFVSKGYLRRTGTLIRSGPYRFVRHPFYLANFIVDLGFIAIAANPYVAGAYVLGFFLIYPGVMKSEETELERIHGQAFRDYRARVPAFLPWKLPASSVAGQTFAFENLVRESETARALRLLILPAFVYLGLLIKADFINHSNPLHQGLPLRAGLLAFLVFGKIGSILLEYWSKKRKVALPPMVHAPERQPE